MSTAWALKKSPHWLLVSTDRLVGWMTSESVCSLCSRGNFPCEMGGSYSGVDWRKVPLFSSSRWPRPSSQEAANCSEILVQIYQYLRRHIPEYIRLQKHILCCMTSNPDSRLWKYYPRRNQDGVVSKVTYLRTWRSGVRIPAGTRDLFLLRSAQPSSGAPLSLLFNWYRWLLSGRKAIGCEVDHLYLFSRLRMSGIIPPLIHCAFMACIGTTLPVPWPARSLFTVVTKLSRFCYFVLRRSIFLFIAEPSAENC